MLSKEVIASISRITGLSADEMLKMDIYHEFDYIQKRIGKKLTFSKKRDSRKLGRGNPLIARRRFRTIEDVDKRMEKIKW